jgi:hypothetical protein
MHIGTFIKVARGWPITGSDAAIEANDYKDAFRLFRQELNRVVPRISLVGQAYTDFLYQPMLIVKDGYRSEAGRQPAAGCV